MRPPPAPSPLRLESVLPGKAALNPTQHPPCTSRTLRETPQRWIAAASRSLVAFVRQEMGAYRLYTVVPYLVQVRSFNRELHAVNFVPFFAPRRTLARGSCFVVHEGKIVLFYSLPTLANEHTYLCQRDAAPPAARLCVSSLRRHPVPRVTRAPPSPASQFLEGLTNVYVRYNRKRLKVRHGGGGTVTWMEGRWCA